MWYDNPPESSDVSTHSLFMVQHFVNFVGADNFELEVDTTLGVDKERVCGLIISKLGTVSIGWTS